MERLDKIHLRPSRCFRHLCCIVYGLALLAIAVCGLPLAGKALLLFVWLIQAYFCWRNSLRPVTALAFSQCQWRLFCLSSDGATTREHTVELCAEPVVSGGLVVLAFRELHSESYPVRYHNLAIWFDSVDREDLRALRVFLRYGSFRGD